MSFYSELKRRNVLRVAILYAVASWVILQVADLLFMALEVPLTAVRFVLAILILGFPLVLLFSWVYELTPEGIKLEKHVDRSESIVHNTGRKLNVAIAVLLIVAIFGLIADRLFPESTSPIDAISVTETTLTDSGAAQAPARSIAVLPFVNMSDDPGNEYFSDGLAEELLNMLASVPRLQVAARTSSFAFKNKNVDIATIARQLNVAHVLEGSVRKSGEQIRVTAQLIKADDGFHLWSESYNRTLDNIFAIQDEISAAVVRELQIKILGEAPRANAINPDAYAMYLQGRYLIEKNNAEDRARALEILLQAVDVEPDFAPAWAAIFVAYFWQANFAEIPQEEAQRLSREAMQRALELDDLLADAHVAKCWVKSFYDFDWIEGIRSAQRALELEPNNVPALHSLAYLSMGAERFERALEFAEQAYALDPLNLETHRHLGQALVQLGRFEEAAEVARRALDLDPNNYRNRFTLGVSHLLSGDPRAAFEEFDKLQQEIFRIFGRALALYALDRPEEAEAEYAILTNDYAQIAAFQIAIVNAYRGDHDAAFEWLEQAYENRDPGIGFTRAASGLKPLHDDPRWQPYLRKIGWSDAQLAGVQF